MENALGNNIDNVDIDHIHSYLDFHVTWMHPVLSQVCGCFMINTFCSVLKKFQAKAFFYFCKAQHSDVSPKGLNQ